MSTTERLRALVAPLVQARDLELYDIDQSGGTLQILVSRPGGIDVDALSDLSRAVSRTLDEHDPIPGRYVLEVSSPGLERPLRRPDHYRGAIGAEVSIKTVAGTEGDRRVKGVLVATDDAGATVALDDGTERHIAYADVERARTVFAWGPSDPSERGRGESPSKARRARQDEGPSRRHAAAATPNRGAGHE